MELYKKALEFATKAHGDQKRKYTHEPYINHPIAVAEIVKEYGGSEDEICAALLHDTVEDTQATLHDIYREFGIRIARIVEDLTDVYTSEAFPAINRRRRKELERIRIAKINPSAKFIKLADLIDNTSSIVDNDPNFSVIYLKEKEEMLKVLNGGDDSLLIKAWDILNRSKAKLGINL